MESSATHFQDPCFASAVMELVRCGDHLRDPGDVAWEACTAIERSLGLDDVILYLTDEDDSALIQTAAAGPKNPTGRTILNPIRIPMRQGICGSVAHTGQSEIVSDTARDPRYIVDDAFRSSEMTVPLVHGDRVIGVLDSESGAKGFYTGEHLAKMQTIASVASAHIARGLADIRLENTRRRLLQLEEIAERQAELEASVTDVERWMSDLDDNAAQNIHHELRTPLNAILGLTELLDDTVGSALGTIESAYIDTLRKSGQSLFERVSDLLDLPEFTGSAPSLVSRQTDVPRVLESVIGKMCERARERGVRLAVDAPTTARPLRCDAAALGRAVAYLLDNAIKFSAGESVLLKLEVDGAGKPTGIAVVDAGIGIEERHHRRIFNPFYQVDQGTSRRFGGLGLGLTHARRLCKAMGLDIELASQPDQGSTFRIRIA